MTLLPPSASFCESMASVLIRGVEMVGVSITRTDMSAADLRAAAKQSTSAKQASRILAIARCSMALAARRRRGFVEWTGRRCATGFIATIRKVWIGLSTGREAAGLQA